MYHHVYRGANRLRVVMVGHPNSGKSTIFQAVASTKYRTGKLTGSGEPYAECKVQLGVDEIQLVDLPALYSLRNLVGGDLEALKYLFWGDARPLVSLHESKEPPAPFSRPDIIVHVIDASSLQRSLELTLELTELGLPVVVALNMMDEAQRKGVEVDCEALSRKLGVPVVPTVALKGSGLKALFEQVISCARSCSCPLPQPAPPHIRIWADKMRQQVDTPQVQQAFAMPQNQLTMHLLEADAYFMHELRSHFPQLVAGVEEVHAEARQHLPRSLPEEVEADRHHRAATLFEQVATLVHKPKPRWEDRLDMLFLHPQWGLLGSMAVFIAILFMVFEISTLLDAVTAAKLVELISGWQPDSLFGVITRAVADGLIGLIGIVVPYMLPLVLMLVLLEQSGIMSRIAFVVDRFFHAIGLHGKVAVPFLLGLGCNVPAITATKGLNGRDRVVSSLLITFVPCSARSAIVLALGAKYLGALGVFLLFALSLLVIAVLGRLLSHRYPEISPGLIQEIPNYAWPRWRSLFLATWHRSSDILTIVTPLLVAGSVLLALLQYFGADVWINALLSPITYYALGLPIVLGVPILFGVLRKELSLVMIYQALGTFEVGGLLDTVQIATFLVFLLFYIPCISTFAVMLKVIGSKEAFFSIALSIAVALLTAVVVRYALLAVESLSW